MIQRGDCGGGGGGCGSDANGGGPPGPCAGAECGTSAPATTATPINMMVRGVSLIVGHSAPRRRQFLLDPHPMNSPDT
jgi:hypothetical protein